MIDSKNMQTQSNDCKNKISIWEDFLQSIEKLGKMNYQETIIIDTIDTAVVEQR